MNYGELKAAVAGWAQRADLTSVIPTFISLAEARIAREFRLKSQISVTTLSLSSGTTALPADFLEFKAVVYQDDATPLRVGTVEQVLNDRAQISGYRPKFAAVIGSNQLYVGPVPDSTYAVNAAYYAKFPALVADSDTNWLLTNHPGVYVWAALAESAPWLQNDTRIAIWEAKYGQDKEQLLAADQRSEFSATALEISNIHTQQVV